MSWYEIAAEDLTHFRSPRTLSSSSNKTPAAATASNLELVNIVAMGTVDNQRVARGMSNSYRYHSLPMFFYIDKDRNNVNFSNDFFLHQLNNNPVLW